jgi:hypothetical protein
VRGVFVKMLRWIDEVSGAGAPSQFLGHTRCARAAPVRLASRTFRVPYAQCAGTVLLGLKCKEPQKRLFETIGAQEGTRTPTVLPAST